MTSTPTPAPTTTSALWNARRFLSRKSLEDQLPSNIRFNPDQATKKGTPDEFEVDDPTAKKDDGAKTGETAGLNGLYGDRAASAVRGMVGPQGQADGRESTAIPLLGRATAHGTKYTVDRSTVFEQWRHECPNPVGWHLSKLGCTTCKMVYDPNEAMESIQLQIIKGCNYFEIDGNATDTFQAISRAFFEALQAFELQREGFVIALRCGIVKQPVYNQEVAEVVSSNSAPIRNRIMPIFERYKASSFPAMQLKTGFRFDQLSNEQLKMLNMRRISPTTVAALSPDWLEATLTNITHQAKIETVDLLWLEGIHALYDGRPEAHVEDDILQLFVFLEQQAKLGAIQFYGISSPHLAPPVPRRYPTMPADAMVPECFRNPKPPPPTLNLFKLMELAKKAGGENHRLRFVQYPMNLTQHQAFSTPLPYAPETTLHLLVKKLGLTAVGYSPIETTDLMFQPQRYHNFPMEADLKSARMNFYSVAERVALKEMEVKDSIEKGPKTLPSIEQLFIGSLYLAHQRQIVNLHFFLDWLNFKAMPAFRRAIMQLKEASSADMKDWAVQYEQLANDMFRLRRRLFDHKHGRRSVNVNHAIDRTSPTLAMCPTLPQKAINFATYGCDVLSCGFHVSRYFHEATELNPMKNGAMTIPEIELRALCESEEVSFANTSPPDPYMLEPLWSDNKFSKQKSKSMDSAVLIDPKNPKFPDIAEELEADGTPASGRGSSHLA